MPGADAPGMPPAKAAPPKPKRPTNFGEYLRDVGDVVHTGSVRAGDDAADFYTIPLTKEALRPGTVFADPYGHVLILVHRVPEIDGKPGVFLAVGASAVWVADDEDNTVTKIDPRSADAVVETQQRHLRHGIAQDERRDRMTLGVIGIEKRRRRRPLHYLRQLPSKIDSILHADLRSETATTQGIERRVGPGSGRRPSHQHTRAAGPADDHARLEDLRADDDRTGTAQRAHQILGLAAAQHLLQREGRAIHQILLLRGSHHALGAARDAERQQDGKGKAKETLPQASHQALILSIRGHSTVNKE